MMSYDLDIDLEDIEAHLYSQVYHSSHIDDEVGRNFTDMFRRWRGSPYSLNKSNQKSASRYFENSNTFFEKRGNKGSPLRFNTVNSPQNNRDVNVLLPKNNEPKVTNDTHNFAVPQFLVSPVNNIVVIPPSPQILTDQNKTVKKKQRKPRSQRPNREAKKIKFLCKNLNERERKIFLRSYLSKKVHKQYLDKLKTVLLSHGVVQNFDGIFTEGSDNSSGSAVSKSNKHEGPTLTVILSSDDENENGQKDVSVKKEKEKDNKNPSESKSDVNTKAKEEKNCSTKDNISAKSGEDDDVIFVEPRPLEVIEIDNASTSTDNNSINEKVADNNPSAASSTSTASVNTQKDHNEITSKERNELLSTPDSNDFLESSSFLDPRKFNFELHGSDFSSKNFAKQKSHTEVFESESSCSDASAPIKIGSIFNEIEFESPAKDIFSESNFESFGDYIMPKRNLPGKNKTKSINNKCDDDAKKGNSTIKETTQVCVLNSSDSSSESDYEDNNLINMNTSKNGSILPQLTSIQSNDIEINTVNKSVEDSNTDKVDCISKNTQNKKQKRECVDENVEKNNVPTKRMKKRNKKNDMKVTEVIAGEKKMDADISKALPVPDQPDNAADVKIYLIDSSDNDDSVNVVNVEKEDSHNNVNELETEPKKGFAAFWTMDKEKFYRKSWGQENMSVDDMQKEMSDDPNMWKIVDADMQLYSRSRGVRCRRCRQYGHKALKCRNKPAVPKCSLCGTLGHAEPRCPNKMCTQCGQYGNYLTTYCSRCAKYRFYKCKICQMVGHVEQRCPDLWRRYFLTIKDGPVVRPDGPDMKPRNELCCSGCASFGHLEYECKYFYNKAHPPVNPKIHSYDEAYPKLQDQTENNNISNHNDDQKEALNKKSPKLPETTLNKEASEINNSGNRSVVVPQNRHNANLNPPPMYTRPTELPSNVFSSNNLQQNVPINPWQVQQNLISCANTRMFPVTNARTVDDYDFNHLPQFISFETPQQNLSPQLRSYNFPKDNINSVSIRDIKRTYNILKEICDKLDSLEKHRNDNPQLILPDIKRLENEMNFASNLEQKLQIRTNIDRLYENLNMILFGIYCLKDGERYVEILKDHLIQLLQCRPHQIDKQLLYTAYEYIFSRKPKNEDYNHLIKLTNHLPQKLSLLSLNEPVYILIKSKYDNFLKMSEVYPFSSTNFQNVHHLFHKLVNMPNIGLNFTFIKEFCAVYNNYVMQVKQNF